MSALTDNLQRVQARIAAACARAGRSPEAVTLVAVSKTHPPARVVEAASAGVVHFGENRVEEAEAKIPAVALPVTWHMIGHVQSRKAKLVAPLFAVVHSVDGLRLAQKLSAAAQEHGRTLDVLFQVNVSGEESKSGFDAANWQTNPAARDALAQTLATVSALPALRLRGLMTMAPIVERPEQARPVFAALAALRQHLAETLRLNLPDLSMGMTDDFEIAIEEGATLVRIGRAIFGERS